MCALNVRMKSYRAACSSADVDSHFFPNQSKSCFRILSNKYTIAKECIGMNVRIGKEYLVGTLREFTHPYSTNIPLIMTINRIYENQNLLSL